MGLKEKVRMTLDEFFSPKVMYLDDAIPIWGYIVASRFHGMDVLKRMDLMDAAFGAGNFTPRERRKISLIAPLSPAEYRAVGPGKPKKLKSKKTKLVEAAAVSAE